MKVAFMMDSFMVNWKLNQQEKDYWDLLIAMNNIKENFKRGDSKEEEFIVLMVPHIGDNFLMVNLMEWVF